MATLSAYVKQTISLDSVTWTPVVPQVGVIAAGVNYVGIKNVGSLIIKIRTNATDPTTEDQIYPGAIETVASNPNTFQGGMTRFLNGQPIAYLQTTSGLGEAVLTGVL